jgi:hypothetical protein
LAAAKVAHADETGINLAANDIGCIAYPTINGPVIIPMKKGAQTP